MWTVIQIGPEQIYQYKPLQKPMLKLIFGRLEIWQDTACLYLLWAINNNIIMSWGMYNQRMAHGQIYTVTMCISVGNYHIYRGGQFGMGVICLFGISVMEQNPTSFAIEYTNQLGYTEDVTYEYLVIGY